MKKIDLKKLTEEDIFVGNIFIIQKPFEKLIKEVRKFNPECTDLSTICFRELAKENAVLIKVAENKYVDIDAIKSNKDIEIINELLSNNSINNNIILSEGTLNPYVGELYIGVNTLRKIKEPKKYLKMKLNALK